MVPLVLIMIFCIVTFYTWSRRRTYILSRQFRGKFALPLVGNSYIFVGKNEDVLRKVDGYLKQFDGYDPVKFWIGPKLCVIFRDPNHVEKILTSQKFSNKMEVYDIIKKCFLGEGLVTASSGPIYRRHKKVVAPLLDLNFTNSCYADFLRYSNSCMEDLKTYCNKGTFNIEPVLHNCFVSTISKTILGKELDVQKEHQFIQDAISIYAIGFTRLARPWLHPEIIYEMTNLSKVEKLIMKRIRFFFQGVIDKCWIRIKTQQVEEMTPLIDSLAESIEKEPDLMNNKVFMDHLFTLFLASEDTLSIVTSFLCVCLGMYPEYQKKLAEELRDHFGEVPKNATLEDIGQLPYLDMCIKETLRLVPIAPLILRRVTEECQVGGWILPKNSAVMIPVYCIHRDKKFWENPDHFHPDHFLPEQEKNRPAYAYLPFSAGTRGCIGKIFANINIRIFMATFLQRFEVEADGKLPDVKLRMDISTRPVNGYRLRIRERTWKKNGTVEEEVLK